MSLMSQMLYWENNTIEHCNINVNEWNNKKKKRHVPKMPLFLIVKSTVATLCFQTENIEHVSNANDKNDI